MNIKNLTIISIMVASLSACGGGTCATDGSGALSLKINAPVEYPAGVALTATLIMTNTSNVNGNNLIYTVPDATNFTGVTITPHPRGVPGQDCTNIPAGGTCQFTATIPAGSHPGSFTVLATPNGVSGQSSKEVISTKSLQANSISVTANLGLVSLPNTNNQVYVLPSSQVVLPNPDGTATAYVSVYNKSYTSSYSQLSWYDNNGVKVTNVVLIGSQQTATGTVNSYQVNIPANTNIEQLQVSTGDSACPLFNGNNANNSCSGAPALINVATAATNIGIVSIQPSYFNMSESYESQIVTITNIGTGPVKGLQPIESSSLFNETNLDCKSTLSVGDSCRVLITYNIASASSNGIATFVANYNNGISNVNTAATIAYSVPSAKPSAILSFNPNSISLSAITPSIIVTLQNTGNEPATFNAPVATSPLSQTNTCNGTVPVGGSCRFTFTVSYASQVTSSSQTYSINYGAATPANLAVDWSPTPPVPYITSVSPVNDSVDVSTGSNVSIVFTESMDISTLNATNILLNESGTANYVTLVNPNYSNDHKQVTFSESSPLNYSTTYNVIIPTPSNIKSEGGASLVLESNISGGVVTSFTTVNNGGSGACNGGYLTVVNSANSITKCEINSDGSLSSCTGGQNTIAGMNQPSAAVANPYYRDWSLYIVNYGDSSLGGYSPSNYPYSSYTVWSPSNVTQPTGISTYNGYTIYIANSNGSLTQCSSNYINGAITGCGNEFTPTGYPSNAYGLGSVNMYSGINVGFWTTNKTTDSVSFCNDPSNLGTVTGCASAGGSNFNAPVAIANSGNYVLVANNGDSTVTRCDTDNSGNLSNCVHTGSNFNQPTSLLVYDYGSFNKVYVTNSGNNSITACTNNNGILSNCASMPYGFYGPVGLDTYDPCG